MFLSFFLLSFVGCTPKFLTGNIQSEAKKICLNLDGNGRLNVQGHKYVFSAQTMLDEEEDKWMMGMSFPLHGQEVIELDLSSGPETEFTEKIQEKVLKEKAGINPQDLEFFMKRWAIFINEVIRIKKNEQKPSENFDWTMSKEMMLATSRYDGARTVQASFYNPTDKFFSRMDFLLSPGQSGKEIKIELIVRKCLDK